MAKKSGHAARHKTRPKDSPTPAIRLEREAQSEYDAKEAQEEVKKWPAQKKKL